MSETKDSKIAVDEYHGQGGTYHVPKGGGPRTLVSGSRTENHPEGNQARDDKGRKLDALGRLVDEQGRSLDATGKPIIEDESAGDTPAAEGGAQ